MRMNMKPLMIACGLSLAVGLLACQRSPQPAVSDDAAPASPTSGLREPTPAANVAAGQLTLERGEWGAYLLADGAGSALYALDGDVAGEGCVDTCTEVWPPMLVSDAQSSAAAGLRPNLVSTVQRPDGTRQVTYGNQPLYRYAGDTGAGRTTGHGVSDQWGQWHLLGVDGQPLAKAPDKAD